MRTTTRRHHPRGPAVLLAACALAASGPAFAQTAVLDDESPTIGRRPARTVVAPDPDDDPPPGAAPREVTRPFHAPQNAMWVEPVYTIAGAFTGSVVTGVGFSHSLSRGLDLVVQGGAGSMNQYGTRYAVGGLSLGLTLFLTGTEPMNGLFVSPKVSFSAGIGADYLGAGVDIGYQYAVGGFFFAPVIGIGWDAVFPQGS
ncbi:MAG: hypothetical protein WCJ30_28115, partial [Deltaproteobacteria bacterium]